MGGGEEHYCRNHLVSWDSVCKPKVAGGLGLRKARDMNIAVLSKVGWALEKGENSLSNLVLRSKYLNDYRFGEVVSRPYNSCSWRGILKCRSCLELGKKWLVGSGRRVNFLMDRWVGDRPLISSVIGNVAGVTSLTVADVIWDNAWDLNAVNHLLPGEKLNEIRAVPIPRRAGCDDTLCWSGEPSGYFSTKSAYALLIKSRGGELEGSYKWIWQLKVPERIRFFMWLLFQDKLNTNEVRAKKRMTDDYSCPRCHGIIESAAHVFRDCYFAVEVWRKWPNNGRAGMGSNISFPDWLRKNCSRTEPQVDAVWWMIGFVITLWNLWKCRNDLVFQQRVLTSDEVWRRSKVGAKEVMEAYNLNQVGRVGEACWVGWRPPEQGCWILNADGAWKQERNAAYAGGLVRDSAGNWVTGFMINIGTSHSLMAELWGVREGLFLAKSLSIAPLVVELDAEMVVKFLKYGVTDTHPCFTLVHDCRMIMEGGWVTEIRHVYRQGNRCADKLANLAQDLSPGVHIIDEPPDVLEEFLADDRLGVKFLRS